MCSPTLVPESVSPPPVAGLMPSLQAQKKPELVSFDPSPEFSLAHLLQVYELAEREDLELNGYVFDDECLLLSE